MVTKIIVTGAGGLIGSHAVKALFENGHQLSAVYRRLDKTSANAPWDVIQGDLLDSNTVQRVDKVKADLLVHCAAVLPGQFLGEEAEQAAQANRAIDEHIVKLCLLGKNRRLVYLSSTSVYGLTKDSTVTEETDLSPIGPYAAAKAEAEREILEKLAGRSAIFRISSPYGPGQRRMNVLRLFIERAMANLDLMYYGTGSRQQDFISALDVGNAILSAVSNVNVSGIFNIASGSPISMRDLAELVARTVPGSNSRVVASQHDDPQENYRALFDIGKALRILGWHPRVRLEDGIRTYAEYLMASNPK